MTRISLAVFDVGGTTVRDTADVPKVLAEALENYGIKTKPSLLKQWRGLSKREIISELVKKDSENRVNSELIYQKFQELMIKALDKHGVEAIPGVEEAFGLLRANGCQVFLTTGFDSRIMDFIIARLNWEEIIDGVVTADDVSRGRPEPDLIYTAMHRASVTGVKSVVSVGDTVNDLRAAQRAGVGISIAVLTGAHDKKQLSTISHTVILKSAVDVPKWLANRNWFCDSHYLNLNA